MSKISEALNQIRNAVFGKDVRQSIIDGIEACYDDATGNPESVARVVQDMENLEKNLNENINDLKSETNQKYNVLDSRMNSFTHLEEGSTTGDAELIDIRTGYDGTTYESAGDAVRGQASELNESIEEISDVCTDYIEPYNKFDKTHIIENSSLNQNGTVRTPTPYSSGSFVTDYIAVDEGDVPRCYAEGVQCQGVHEICYYNEDKTFISYKSYGGFGLEVPTNCRYIRYGIQPIYVDSLLITLNSTNANYSEYYEPRIIAKGTPIVIKVDKNGNGDFTSIYHALNSIADSSEKKPYLVEVYEGEYDVCSDFTSSQINSANYSGSEVSGFCGVVVPNGVTLKGVGDRSKIILKGEIATSYAQDKREQISTLNLKGNCSIENMTITSKYIRYAVHDDFIENNDSVHIIKDCIMINYVGSDGGNRNHAYGLGTKSGTVINIENCSFEPSIVYHTNNDFTRPCRVTLKNTVIKGRLHVWDLLSGMTNFLDMYDIKYDELYYVFSGSHEQEIEINGIGNSEAFITCPSNVVYHLSETTERIATSNINIGKCVKAYSPHRVTNTTDYKDFIGICIKSVNAGQVATIQTNGFINTNILGINVGDISVGDYFTVGSDGKLTKTGATYENAVAVVKFKDATTGYLKMRI